MEMMSGWDGERDACAVVGVFRGRGREGESAAYFG